MAVELNACLKTANINLGCGGGQEGGRKEGKGVHVCVCVCVCVCV